MCIAENLVVSSILRVDMYLRVYKLTPWRSPLEADIYFLGQEIPLSGSQAVINTGPFA